MLNRYKIGTRIGGGFALGLAILTAIGIISYRATKALIDNAQQERHTYEVLSQLAELELQLVSAETGQRGYIITGQPRYLEPYDNALGTIDRAYNHLQTLISDNPDQRRRADALQPLLEGRMNRLQEGIRLRDSQGFSAAQDFTLSNEGQQLMEQIRSITNDMKQDEENLLRQRSEQVQAATQQTLNTIVLGIPLAFILLSLVGLWLSRNISAPLRRLSHIAERIAAGDLSATLTDSNTHDETGVLTRTFNTMIVNLRETIKTNQEQRWLKSSQVELSHQLQGERNVEAIARLVLSYLAEVLFVHQGVFYVLDETNDPPLLKLLNSYAYQERKHIANQFRLGEGLVGQCALEKKRILLTNVPDDYIRIHSGLGETAPRHLVVVPLLFETQVNGVIELATLQPFTELQLAFLDDVSRVIGVMLNAIASYNTTQTLLEESQALAQELRMRQEDLLHSNQILEEQAQSLRESELLLQQQQEELQQSNEELQQLNEELEEKAELLESQKQQVERKNLEIEQARRELEDKAEQLALSSRYKSEFLSNMSHELRTPLNSLLILAKLLSENTNGNLTQKQVEYSQTIYSAGNDLLALINDILDLAKIESGTMAVDLQLVSFIDLQLDLDRTFREIALSKGLEFTIDLQNSLPAHLTTDPKRLLQILKNLLSNAFKFTEQGSVTLRISPEETGMIAFAVHDTGIGIPADKQHIIFEAFQQADGTTSRKYGGTGLGLSISMELSRLLKGRITLVSQPGQGSTFTLHLPEHYDALKQENPPVQPVAFPAVSAPPPRPDEAIAPPSAPLVAPPLPAGLEDDRANLQPGDPILLLIEDDSNFARIVLDMARGQGFKVLIALQGRAGLALAQQFMPHAITLDIHLPDMEGWVVLEHLKRNPQTRHIPIHILTVDDRQPREFQMGAIAHIQKPVSPDILTQTLSNIRQFIERQVKHLLVIEDDPMQSHSIIELIGGTDVNSTAIHMGAEALAWLRSHPCDCVVLDLGLPDMSGFDLIEQIKQEPQLSLLPIVVYTGKELTEAEETQLRRLAETIIVKDVRSPERLLDETALFLHRVQANLPEPKRQLLEQLHQSDPTLAGKKVLIVDDDVRNIFALTSLLENHRMEVRFAENGRLGLEILEANPDINIVLMDVMMPEMDGYETTRAIRQRDRFRSLPVIALTAKAMQGDREKCIEAGASDYITKPVDAEQLMSLMRLWLYR